jgi:hypothetical protein
MGASPVAPKRTLTGTFRIPEDVYKAIQQEAKERRISLNTLVNQVLYARVFEEIPAVKAMFVMMPKAVYSEFLSSVSEERAKQIGQADALRIAKSIILARHGEVTLEAVIEHLRLFAERSGYGQFSDLRNHNKRIVTIIHEFGQKGSVLFASHAEALFQTAGLRPKIITTEEALVVEI